MNTKILNNILVSEYSKFAIYLSFVTFLASTKEESDVHFQTVISIKSIPFSFELINLFHTLNKH
jgi:hypothetical protein